eukprot:3842782-Lingulodinium_polyedra.AAC.1
MAMITNSARCSSGCKSSYTGSSSGLGKRLSGSSAEVSSAPLQETRQRQQWQQQQWQRQPPIPGVRPTCQF